MKLILSAFRNLAVTLTLGLCLGNVVWSAPSIESIEVSPNPLVAGQSFTIAVTASPEVTKAIATITFPAGEPRRLQMELTKQGPVWTGSGFLPTDLRLQLPALAGAMIRVILFDAARQRAEGVLNVSVNAPNSAVFAGGILTVTGDDQDNTFTVSRDAAGAILINGGEVAITGGVPTVANTTLIRVLGLPGNDVLLVDDSNGPMPPSNLFGGEGDDTLTGSANADELDGGPGNDTLFGRDGNDHLFGGPGNDTLIGGRGVDEHFGGEGDDQIVWNPDDGSDVIEGEGGEDTLLFNGSNADELVDLAANGQRLRFFRNMGDITMDCDGVERVIFRALGGADQVTVNDLCGTQVTHVAVDLFIAPGVGDDMADTILVHGTDANDVITVSGSADAVDVLGLSAAVTVVGADKNLDKLVVNGRGGADIVDFVGSDGSETVELSSNVQQLRFSYNAVNLIMDFDGVEQVNFYALGGADLVVVNDLTGTPVTKVGIDLSGNTLGTGDGQVDTVSVNGTDTNDFIAVSGSAFGVEVAGLSAKVIVVGAEQGLDRLVIHARGGADEVDASAVEAGAIGLTLDGGLGNDRLLGGQGNDVLLGAQGDDLGFGGGGDDTFIWSAGDGSDIVEGQGGQDTMLFNGSNLPEAVDISANGQRLRFFREVDTITMDCNEVETVTFNALGGPDTITVNDLSGTGVSRVNLDLARAPGSGAGDRQADTVIINGTPGSDAAIIVGTPVGASILGLSAIVSIVGTESALDRLIMHMLAGDDMVDASALQAGAIALTADGGAGADVLIGGAGADVLIGGDGDDVLRGGPGLDQLDGGPGNNIVIQD